MDRKCDNCDRKATVHVTEIEDGKKIEKHLCEHCAAESEGPTVKSHQPLNELLTNFVLKQSGIQTEQPTGSCEFCGSTWSDFRQSGLLGCEHDYELFADDLTPLLQRAHERGTHHVGKVPTRAGGGSGKIRQRIDEARLKKELEQAIQREDYERAAELRDKIQTVRAEARKAQSETQAESTE